MHTYCNHEAAARRLEKIIEKARNGDRAPRTTPLPRPAKQLHPDDIGQILTAWHDGNNIAAITRLLGWNYSTRSQVPSGHWHRHPHQPQPAAARPGHPPAPSRPQNQPPDRQGSRLQSQHRVGHDPEISASSGRGGFVIRMVIVQQTQAISEPHVHPRTDRP